MALREILVAKVGQDSDNIVVVSPNTLHNMVEREFGFR